MIPACGNLLRVACVAMAASALAPAQDALADSRSAFDEALFLRAANEADLRQMPAYFANVADEPGLLLDELRVGFDARFVRRTEPFSPATGHALVDAVVEAFRQYWSRALLDPMESADAGAELEKRLTGLVTDNAAVAPTSPGPFARAAAAIETAGYGVSISDTPPLHDLVLWSEEETAYYRVDLTDGTETVKVIFIDGLISQGWRHFATLGLNATSGWTGGDALYCVRWGYDTASERFRVSYLKHEARHFADFRRYPGLDEASMEYRAKLTELAYAGSSAADLLRRFATERNAQGSGAHGRANDRVVRDMYRQIFDRPMPEHLDAWSLLGADRINPAARYLLERNTAELE